MVKKDLFNRVNEGTSIATDFPHHLSLSLYVFSINISTNELYNSLLFLDRIFRHWKSVAKRIGNRRDTLSFFEIEEFQTARFD